MTSTAERGSDPSARERLMRQLIQRVESAHDLAATVRERLRDGDREGIEEATARLETIAQEFKLLAEEYDRLPEPSATEARAVDAALEAAVTRLARSSAVTGGFLERLVHLGRGRLDLLALAKDGTYSRSGHVSELEPRGVRLQERA